MITSIRPASLEDVLAIVEIEKKTNQMPWSKAQFLSSMEVGHYSAVMHEENEILGFAIYSPIIPESHLLNISITFHYGVSGGSESPGANEGKRME